MSVQLVLYPQNHQGQFTAISTPFFNQYVSDYSFNVGTLGTGFSGTANTQTQMVSKLSPLNIWQQYNTTGGLAVSNPATISNGKITLDSASGSNSLTGIYQLISNLQIGSTYVLKVQRLAGTTGITTIGNQSSFTNSNVLYHPFGFFILPNSVGTHTFSFTATETDHVFLINYLNDDNANLEIGEVSIIESVSSAPTIDVFRDGQVICDLYDESSIPLSLSIDNFKNVHEKKQSFSKPFKLPATKRNNKIFNSLFDVTKSIKDDVFSFNPYKKTKAILKENGYTIFDGYLRLIDVVNKDNEISYNVNMFADTITLADTLKDKKFSDIDFTELKHAYNKTNIKNTFSSTGVSYTNSSTSGFRSTESIKYPFVKWNGDTFLDSGNVSMLKLEDAFRPFMSCKYLLDRIINESGFTYSSDFLNSTDSTKLFMDFNWGEGITPTNSGFQSLGITSNYTPSSGFNNINFTTGQIPVHYNTSTKKFTADQDNLTFQGTVNLQLLNSGSTEAFKIRVIHKDSSGNTLAQETINHSVPTTAVTGIPHTWSKSFNFTLNDTDTLEIQSFVSGGSSNITIDDTFFNAPTGITLNTVLSVKTSSEVELLEAFNIARGDLGQWEFVKGIFNLFNLIAIQDKDNPNNMFIEPYKSVFVDDSQSQYISSKTLDWTDKVDISEIVLKPLKLSKKVEFDYVEEGDDYAKKIYKSFTGNNYGYFEKTNNDLTILEGTEKVSASPFGSTFVKPIFSNFTTEMTIPVIYKGNEDGTFTGFKNKPRILFNNGSVTMASNTYFMPAQNGQAEENQASFLQFSHLTDIPTNNTTKDYNFNTEQMISTLGNTPVNNLYNTYWFHYYDELYNPDTREVKLKIYLTPSDITNFEFYYKIRIKNRLYRVNKIDYRPYELSNVELILIP